MRFDQCFTWRLLSRVVMTAALRLQKLMSEGMDMADAFNGSGVYLVKAAQVKP